MAKHVMSDLLIMQAYPLDMKVLMVQRRVREWVEWFGLDGVYISFSGGKDSTVLLHIARQMYPDILAVFVDTGLEYPEIREFVKTFPNVTKIKPKKTFRQVIDEYGYPFISKEVSEKVQGARAYVKSLSDSDREVPPYAPFMADLLGIDRRIEKDNPEYEQLKKGIIPLQTEGKTSSYDVSKYKFFLEAPFEISAKCCDVMKKAPAHSFEKRTGRKPITAQMASESRLRTSQWLKNGCNGFNMKSPISNPMSFWTEQDVLLYIKENNLSICSVYGDIVEVDGKLKTTGCDRTGCMFCGYGCHLEKPGEGRFLNMKETHPKQYEYIMRPWEQETTVLNPETGNETVVITKGLDYKEVIDWINEHGGFNIEY